MREFETTNIHLAAAILTHIPRANVLRITPDRVIDGKRLIIIAVPVDQAETFKKIVEEFQSRHLSVPLYRFNRSLNLLRDRLLQREGSHAI